MIFSILGWQTNISHTRISMITHLYDIIIDIIIKSYDANKLLKKSNIFNPTEIKHSPTLERLIPSIPNKITWFYYSNLPQFIQSIIHYYMCYSYQNNENIIIKIHNSNLVTIWQILGFVKLIINQHNSREAMGFGRSAKHCQSFLISWVLICKSVISCNDIIIIMVI